ncbi:apolipoprotein N-acyltransferase [Rhodospirillum centenum]|uniref:Apolipoprotein N-acyltransferase n=1 Tax=Rhodospirillum centenum (strain ATCC 51521 / SW) TaxID=414684 RepID=B6IVL8_RHOCS|nr:apolipoprotein N-acyltransferase [Rhodospirillum centenum]ACJ00342.1 apolipoprotein N-acyltransferase Lnt, putative [Rhodospirillum centenum SW]
MTDPLTVPAAGAPLGDRVVRFVRALPALAGWRRYAVAFTAGAVAVPALPPAHLVPLLWLAFPVLVLLLRGAERDGRLLRGRAFWTGWWFGFGHFVFGLYWISVALWTDIGRWWWAVPVAVCGLPALLAFFPALAALLHGWVRLRLRLTGVAEALAFAVAWAVLEWLRGHVATGFPWNLTGYAWTAVLPVLQSVSVVGIYGLSLLTVAAAALATTLADGRWRPPAAALVLLAVLAAWGGWRMAGTEGRSVEGVVLRLVQPAIPQTLKWDREAREDNLRRHLELSAAPGRERVTHVVWPETAVPFFPERDGWVTQVIARAVPPGGLLLTGIPRLGLRDGAYTVTNSMVAVDAGGAIVASFDKFHLVPFGEYLPFRFLLPAGMQAVAAVGMDTSPGPGPRTLALPGLPPFSPLICYEVIFPAAVTPAPAVAGPRPAWLLNLTNDAWYGETAGPHQHWAIALTRAVEEGMPLVRAANTGISGVVDPYGRTVGRLALGSTGVLDAALPAAHEGGTPYVQYGDLFFALTLLGMLILIGFFARKT